MKQTQVHLLMDVIARTICADSCSERKSKQFDSSLCNDFMWTGDKIAYVIGWAHDSLSK